MEAILGDYKRYNAFNEVYEVVKTVEVVGYDRKIRRVEVLKCYSNTKTPYIVNYLIRDEATVQPTYPKSGGKFERQPESVEIWHRTSEPWVVAQTAEEALAQALHWLAERARQQA